MSRRRGNVCPDGSHETCPASDSRLPVCRCWCAQCREDMAAVRARGAYFVTPWPGEVVAARKASRGKVSFML
jgi:hypothetical protein